ncbi:hypothetical protein H4R33_005910 [Dimargaris cristalligena]|nr:hypothetical protein H4R33_005910 [Dimargaris cristalligena]
MQGIHEHLNCFLMKYLPTLDGVVLSYSNIRFSKKWGRVVDECPFPQFWIQTDLLVWKPHVGSMLEGRINIESADHIGLLIYNTFNVSIPADLIPQDKFIFQQNEKYAADFDAAEDEAANPAGNLDKSMEQPTQAMGEWVSKITGQSMSHNGLLRFKVASYHQVNELLSVTGSLL